MAEQRRILSVHTQYSGATFGWAGLYDRTNLDEWDVVLWPQHNLLSVSATLNAQILQMNVRRIKEFHDWLVVGRTMVVLLESADKGPELMPLGHQGPKVTLHPANGSSVKGAGPRAVQEILKPWYSQMYYVATFEAEGATPIASLNVWHTKKPPTVGAIYAVGKGHLIIAPPIQDDSGGMLEKYVSDLAKLPSAIAENNDVAAWTANYRTAKEQQVWAIIDNRREQIERLNAEIETALVTLSSEAWLKKLISATASDLQHAVGKALEELGFRVAILDGRRTDILARDGNRLFAFEVKGPDNRSARSEDLGQANRWLGDLTTALVSSDECIAADADLAELDAAMQKLDVKRSDPTSFQCKAVLVLEPTRLTHLAGRVQPAFAPNLIGDMVRAGVCGLSGSQLLGLVLEARISDCDRARLREKFFQTAGLIQADDWKSFLHFVGDNSTPKV